MNKTLIIAMISLFVTLQIQGQNTNGDNLFDDNYLHEFRFESADTNLFISTKDYQQLKMIVDGNIIDSVGMKRKGNISAYYNPNKLAIKIKTNKYVSGKKYDGIKEFTLHMNYQDPTMLREKLTYDICNEMGLFSLRTAFAKVYINNNYWGLYTIVEGKDEMYKQKFDNRKMDAIESLDFGDMCFISNNPSDYDFESNGGNPTYILENGDETTAWPRFSTMIDKANNTPDDQYLQTASTYLNLEDFFKYQAINVYLMNMDSYISFRGNQIYFYDETVNIWQIMPWDFNASFGMWNTTNYQPLSYPMIPDVIENGCIAGKLNNIPTLKNYYLDAMCQLHNSIGDTTNYFAKIDNWANQIRQAVYNDNRKHISNNDFENGIAYGYHNLFGENQPALKTFLAARLEVVKQGFINEGYSCDPTQSIEHIENIHTFNIFPNPTSDFINFDIKQDLQSAYELKILNSMGQVVLNKSVSENKQNIQNLNTGIYLVILTEQTGKIYRSKFIKK
jgi:hypothetical protein